MYIKKNGSIENKSEPKLEVRSQYENKINDENT